MTLFQSPFWKQMAMLVQSGIPFLNLVTDEPMRFAIHLPQFAKHLGYGYCEIPLREMPTVDLIRKQANFSELIIAYDPHGKERFAIQSDLIPFYRNHFSAYEENGITLITATEKPLQEELFFRITADLPNRDEFEALLIPYTQNLLLTPEEKAHFLRKASGLSYHSFRYLLNLHVFQKATGGDTQFAIQFIDHYKKQLLQEVLLEILEPVSIEEVGGLSQIKSYLQKCAYLFHLEEAPYSFKRPRGILLAGVPGCGKTLIAKATGDLFRVPVVRMDIGRFMSKWVGESEANFERALEMLEQLSPLVVLIDEIEKIGFSSYAHEVTSRLLARFLFWLQEHRSRIFILATANHPEYLPVEFIRTGRFDRNYFIDLPTLKERMHIFSIHLKKAGVTLNPNEMEMLAEMTNGFTGAEIEQVVTEGVTTAIYTQTKVTTKHLLDALQQITPLSKMRQSEIEKIRKLLHHGFFPGNEPES